MRALTRPRIRLLTWLLLLCPLAWSCASGPAARAQAHPRPLVSAVDSFDVTVGDMDRSVAFYMDVLSFQKVSDVEVAGEPYEHLEGVFGLRMRVVRLKLGDEFLELTQFLTPRGRLVPPDSRSNDRWFQHISIIVGDMGRAYALLRAHHVGYVSAEPQRLPDWNKEAGGIEAFYFSDPDGHTLEILHFPPDKGDAKWHQGRPSLFLGIDHSAVVVADTEASLKFYRDMLGMKVMGSSENYGTEQEHLNNVFGARLRITSLRAAAGPGIELLEYRTPQDGRPIPADAHANDLSHWQTIVRTRDADSLRASADQMPLVSPGAVTLPDGKLGVSLALAGRDPDGHVLELTQP